ncbi:MAG TPA: Na/Pi cotransporter family protein [Marinilabiliaceae bacterium]|nr:Na/Pi cotransporter family protein [Marinilabiliaceae bacterium]
MDVFFIVITLIGGLGLFLLGMEFMSSAAKKMAGHTLRNLLEKFLRTKTGGVGFGVLLTLLFQSSGAASVVLIGFIDASIITFVQTLPVMLGTGIGTTITAQLISFNVGSLALMFVGIGFFIRAFTKGKWSNGGQIVLGFGILFYGMRLMSEGMAPLREMDGFVELLLYLENPLPAILVGMIFTAAIQSSAAFIGILITLVNSGLITFDASLPLILGTNIGTTFVGLIAALTASYDGKRLAVANALFRLFGVFLFIWFIQPWGQLTIYITGDSAASARLLANAHTIFNFVMAATMLPFTAFIGKVATKLVPLPKKQHQFSLHHLTNDLLKTPELSIPFLQKEVQDMGAVVYNMVRVCLRPFVDRDEKALENIRHWEERTDFYRDEINQFLVKMNEKQPMDQWGEEIFRFLHAINELEQIADVVSVNISRQAEKWLKTNIQFSAQGQAELLDYHQRSIKQLERALTLMSNWSPADANKMKKKYKKYALMAFDFEREHYKRLFTPNTQSLESSKVHMEILNLLRIVNSRATNFGRMVFISEEYEW